MPSKKHILAVTNVAFLCAHCTMAHVIEHEDEDPGTQLGEKRCGTTSEDVDNPGPPCVQDYPPCAPMPGIQCSAGEGDVSCVPIWGWVYDWNPAAGCRKLVYSSMDRPLQESVPFECVNTGVPYEVGGGGIGLFFAEECYVRYLDGSALTVAILPHSYSTTHPEESGWTRCSNDLNMMVSAIAPDCP